MNVPYEIRTGEPRACLAANPSVGYLDNREVDGGHVTPPKPGEPPTYCGLRSRHTSRVNSASASSKNRYTCVIASEGRTTPRAAAWPPKASACLESSLSTCNWVVGGRCLETCHHCFVSFRKCHAAMAQGRSLFQGAGHHTGHSGHRSSCPASLCTLRL